MNQTGNQTRRSRHHKLVVMALLLLFSACNDRTLDQQVGDARQHLNEGHRNVAIIELKNVLSEAELFLPALTLLNEIYAEHREYKNIIELLTKAEKSGVANEGILLSLTDALIHEAKFDQAIKVINKYPDYFSSAQGLALMGHYHAGMNQTSIARSYYAKSLKIDPALISAHLGMAQEYIVSAGEFSSRPVSSHEISSSKASIDWVSNTNVSQDGNKQTDDPLIDAKDHLKKVFEHDPDNLVAHYLEASIAYLEKNFKAADYSLQKVLAIDSEHKESLLLSGRLHLEMGHLDKSSDFLQKYLAKSPEDLTARIYLATILLRQKHPDQTIELLERFHQIGAENAEYLLVLGNAYLYQKDNQKAIDHFNKAHAIYPSSALVKMYLAMGYLANEQHDKAIEFLQEVLQIDPENEQAGISLVTTLLQNGNYILAEKYTTLLIQHHPKAPVPYYLAGLVYTGLNNVDQAVQSFTTALKLQHAFVPATIRLAQLYRDKGDFESAKKEYQAGLYTSPYHPEILLEMALTEQQLGNDVKAIEYLELARDRNPRALTSRLILGSYYLRRGQVTDAQTILSEVKRLGGNRADVKMFTGQMLLATGRYAEAVEVFSELIRIEPDSPELLTRYASALIKNGQKEEGRKALQVAIQISNQLLPETLIESGELELSEGNYNEAIEIASELKDKFADLPAGYLLQGDISMQLKQAKEAIVPYQQALERGNRTQFVLKLSEAYLQSGKRNEAYEVLYKAAAQHSDDLRIGLTLASMKQQDGDDQAVKETYYGLLKKHPDNALLLNNLAWLYDRTDRKKALEYAERAYKVTPELPEVLDTYGWFCVQEGRLTEGLDLLETAVKKAPSRPEFHYHLAEALLKSGQKVSAIESLKIALASQEPFNGRNDAEALFQSLVKKDD